MVPPHPIRVCSSSHIYLCQPNKMTYRISALLRGLGRCCFLFNPRERSIYYRLYDLSPHLFLQVVFLVNIYFLSSLGLLMEEKTRFRGTNKKHSSKTNFLEVTESSITPVLLNKFPFMLKSSFSFISGNQRNFLNCSCWIWILFMGKSLLNTPYCCVMY